MIWRRSGPGSVCFWHKTESGFRTRCGLGQNDDFKHTLSLYKKKNHAKPKEMTDKEQIKVIKTCKSLIGKL